MLETVHLPLNDQTKEGSIGHIPRGSVISAGLHAFLHNGAL